MLDHHVMSTQTWTVPVLFPYIDGLVQKCSNSRALAMELLQYCTKPYIYGTWIWDLTLVITVLADALAPANTGSSTGIILTTQWNMFHLKFLCYLWFIFFTICVDQVMSWMEISPGLTAVWVSKLIHCIPVSLLFCWLSSCPVLFHRVHLAHLIFPTEPQNCNCQV